MILHKPCKHDAASSPVLFFTSLFTLDVSFLVTLPILQKMTSHDNTEELIDYEDEQDVIANGAAAVSNGAAAGDGDDKEKKNFSGIHSTGFR